MARMWIGGLVGLAILGGAAAGGYVYVDHRLRTAVDEGLAEINAFYADLDMPPFTYDRLETDVLGQSVSLFGLRQAGTFDQGGMRQEVETTLARLDAVSAADGTLDIFYETSTASSRVAEPGAIGPQVDVTMRTARGEIAGVRLDRLDLAAGSIGLFGWYDQSRFEDSTITVQTTDPSDGVSRTVTFDLADAGMESDPDGGGRLYMTGLTGEMGSVDQATIRFRASDALGNLLVLAGEMGDDPTPQQVQDFQKIMGAYGRSVAGFSVTGVDLVRPDTGKRLRVKEVALDTLTWQDELLTALVFRIDTLSGDMSPTSRAQLTALGLDHIDLSARIDLRYSPETGTLRVAPLSATLEGLAAATLEAEVGKLYMAQDAPSAGPPSRRELKARIQKAMLQSEPGRTSLRVEDLGGLKALVAAQAEQGDVPPARIVMALALQAATMVEPVLGPEAAEAVYLEVAALLTEKDVLTLTVAPSTPLSFGAMAAQSPAEVLDVSVVTE